MALRIHAHLELHVLYECLQNTVPVLAKRSVAMARYGNSSVLSFAVGKVGDFDLVKFNFIDIVFLLLYCFHLG